jgi:hypothetical protein
MSEKLEVEIKFLKEQLAEVKKIILVQSYFLFFFLLALIGFLLELNHNM